MSAASSSRCLAVQPHGRCQRAQRPGEIAAGIGVLTAFAESDHEATTMLLHRVAA
jgi:hypothetical protein